MISRIANLALLIIAANVGLCRQPRNDNSFDKLKESFQVPWEEQAANCGLSNEAISLLRVNGFVICDKSDAVQDELYANPNTSYCSFITTDHTLKVYHRLFQESFHGVEENISEALPVVLLGILESLDQSRDAIETDGDLNDRSYKIIQFVVGVSLRLMDSSFSYNDKELDLAVEKEVSKILKAEEQTQIAWPALCGDKDSVIDYSIFSPHGIYLSSDTLSRYFRASEWLRSVQFDINNEEMLLSAVMIAESTKLSHCNNDEFKSRFNYLFKMYPVVCASYDYNNLSRLERDSWYYTNNCWGDLQLIREYLKEGQSSSGEFPHSYYSSAHWYLPFYEDSLRIISDQRMVSDVLFLNSMEGITPGMAGLTIPASLGSEYAMSIISLNKKTFISDMRDIHLELRPNALSGRLPHVGYQYIKTLEAFAHESDFDYPGFMRTEAWEIKKSNTLLTSWFLNSPAFKAIGSNNPPVKSPSKHRSSGRGRGFTDSLHPALIEPNPKFYRELETLARDTRVYLDCMGAFGKELVSGKSSTDMVVNNDSKMINYKDDKKLKLLKKWEEFEKLCRRYEQQSQNQLRFSRMKLEESVSLEEYLDRIRTLFLPGGMRLYNADDFVKVFPLYFSEKDGEVPISAFGKSRKIYVLYPWGAHFILCEGSVNPYYEFIGNRDFSDQDWVNLMESNEQPQVPSWLAPIFAGGYHKEGQSEE